MSKFKPERLSVTFIPPATAFVPIDSRKYTLTHSDLTGELFLAVGNVYDYQAINFEMRDEVLADWITINGEYLLYAKVYISNGEYDLNMSRIRYMIFKKELDLALTAIVYGDKNFYTYYPWLLDAPIYVQFSSIYPEFNQVAYYGTPRMYLNKVNKKRTPEAQA
ncbi:staygreen family protein [Mesobacillus subterraneus]|uniref:staygreen family protein n=1 Tax=Mesobacillus subterraneus TaxID=285983 RepID=UPI001CFED729|nr:staygreen family protein [Mesobacillus subterraneus]WLR57101.1 staygreen family protein [Mesobacillus subterraneus]